MAKTMKTEERRLLLRQPWPYPARNREGQGGPPPSQILPKRTEEEINNTLWPVILLGQFVVIYRVLGKTMWFLEYWLYCETKLRRSVAPVNGPTDFWGFLRHWRQPWRPRNVTFLSFFPVKQCAVSFFTRFFFALTCPWRIGLDCQFVMENVHNTQDNLYQRNFVN